jgi:hypothetical protein
VGIDDGRHLGFGLRRLDGFLRCRGWWYLARGGRCALGFPEGQKAFLHGHQARPGFRVGWMLFKNRLPDLAGLDGLPLG